MTIASILCSKTHLYSPFTIPDKKHNKELYLSTAQKVASVSLAILIGVASLGIGGIIAFYVTTAVMKAKLLENSPSPEDKSPKKAVNFAGARARVFDKNQPPEQVGKADSIEVENFTKRNPPKRNATQLQEANRWLSSFFGKADPYPTSIQNRRVPPLSQSDTIMVVGGAIRSIHSDGTEKFFRDDEILKLHPSNSSIEISESVNADLTDNNKIVIQQQAKRGCTAAVAAMLIYDAGKKVDVSNLQSTNLGNTQSIVGTIKRAELTPIVTELTGNPTPNELLTKLKELLLANGSAIVSTGNDIGGHVVVVDHISDDLQEVRLRDPYHGWDITVTKDAFLRGFTGGNIIQLAL